MQEAIYVDAAVALFLLFSGALSARTGFVKAVLSIVAWLLATSLTVFLFPIVQPMVSVGGKANALETFIAGAIMFVLLLAVFMLVAHAIGRWFDRGDVAIIDRIFGFLFGLLRGAILVTLAYLIISLIFPPRDHPKWVQQAVVAPFVAEGAELLTWLAPDRVEELKKTLDESRKQAEDAVREERRKKQQ